MAISDAQTDPITLDHVFSALSDPTQRRILTKVAQEPRKENEFFPADLESADKELKQFEAVLHHRHLPYLDGLGLIEWHRESNTITPGRNLESVRPFITVIMDGEHDLPED